MRGRLINTIWDWLKDVSALPPAEEDVQKNRELLATILEVSLDRIRRQFKEKGHFVFEMIKKVRHISFSVSIRRARYLTDP